MPDRRIGKTDNAIFEALQSLSESKPLSQITVTDVARAANITRKTFYDHFPSVTDAYQAFIDAVVTELVERTEEDWRAFLESDLEWTPYLVAKTRLSLFLGNIREFLEPQVSSNRMRNRNITLEEEVRFLHDPFYNAIREGLLGELLMDSDECELVSEFVLTGILWIHRRILSGCHGSDGFNAQEKLCDLVMDGIGCA